MFMASAEGRERQALFVEDDLESPQGPQACLGAVPNSYTHGKSLGIFYLASFRT